MKRVVAIAAPSPIARPTPIRKATSPSTMRSTRDCSAPSAMRIPISFRRRVTLYDIAPYNPIVARTRASPPKNPESVASSRSRDNDSSTCSASVLNCKETSGLTLAIEDFTAEIRPVGAPAATRSSNVTDSFRLASWLAAT